MAASLLAARSIARTTVPRAGRRLLSTTRVVREEAAAPNLGSVPPAKKPVGAFRGGCVLPYSV